MACSLSMESRLLQGDFSEAVLERESVGEKIWGRRGEDMDRKRGEDERRRFQEAIKKKKAGEKTTAEAGA